MPLINLSQYQFVLSDPWQAGHVMTELEASTLNYHRADLIRKIAIRWIHEAEDAAPDGVLTIEELDRLTAAIASLDEQYQISVREPPKIPAFNHVLREVAIEQLAFKLENFKSSDIRAAMNESANREKARNKLVASLRSIYGDGESEINNLRPSKARTQ